MYQYLTTFFKKRYYILSESNSKLLYFEFVLFSSMLINVFYCWIATYILNQKISSLESFIIFFTFFLVLFFFSITARAFFFIVTNGLTPYVKNVSKFIPLESKFTVFLFIFIYIVIEKSIYISQGGLGFISYSLIFIASILRVFVFLPVLTFIKFISQKIC